ncbi:hypothetical protein ONS95_002582 [Cadophora gregata]|uniref:uncharacterized protein n=1 Tax=Cadophora gregata TaxID=51156 RepID=UPI0026DD65F2|nr:uncharacterized protein ONS95_002582 [Cadophora gregata]KAK0109911.1 hypothetical protein ONS95_002582 [Cadophora gregata]KAK0110460.1 hypothetical protein ONS96_002071 [Cadophora gregata f. sp. sojae]
MRHDHFDLFFHILLTSTINVSRLAKSIIWSWYPFKFFSGLYLTFIYHHEIRACLEILSDQNGWLKVFEVLFLFKFIKVIVHTISFLLYKPYPLPRYPSVTSQDVTVIIPTIGAIDDVEFRETLSTILANLPAEIIVSTVGEKRLYMAQRVCAEELDKARALRKTRTRMRAMEIDTASKRKQIFEALKYVQTSIVSLADDHVFWGDRYLTAALAPFEDPQIGGVGTNKRVRRLPFEFSFPNFLNFIACNYLERHNFECTASIFIDQAVFVLSGRTVFYRTNIFRHPRFEQEYCRETWLFGIVGKSGFAVDDDNLLTRFTIGITKYKVWFQNCPESTMVTALGEPGKFFKQMDRWIRTTWRSNSTSLFSDQTPWKTQPWSVYAIYLSSFVNFALFYDTALFTTLWYGLESGLTCSYQFSEHGTHAWSHHSQTRPAELLVRLPTPLFVPASCHQMAANNRFGITRGSSMCILALILFTSKMIKPLPHFWRNPRDILYIPFYILFGYYHSLIKLKALFTVCVISWGSRQGVE